MRCGADDYIQKPFLNEAVVERLKRIGDYRSVLDENRKLREELRGDDGGLPGIVGRSRAMQDVFKVVRTVADNEASVLLGDYLFVRSSYLASTLENTFASLTIGRATNLVCEGELITCIQQE